MLDGRWTFNIKHCTTFLFRILPLLFSTFSPICIMTLKIVFKRKLFHIEMKIVPHRDDAKIRISSPLPVSILAILSKYSLTPFLCIFSTQYHIQDSAISWSNAFMTNPFLSWKYVTRTHWSLFCSGHQWYLMFQPVKQNFHILSRRMIPITLQSVKNPYFKFQTLSGLWSFTFLCLSALSCRVLQHDLSISQPIKLTLYNYECSITSITTLTILTIDLFHRHGNLKPIKNNITVEIRSNCK